VKYLTSLLIKVIKCIECHSQLIYCISDHDITKQINDNLSIGPRATFDNFGSANSHDASGIRHNLCTVK